VQVGLEPLDVELHVGLAEELLQERERLALGRQGLVLALAELVQHLLVVVERLVLRTQQLQRQLGSRVGFQFVDLISWALGELADAREAANLVLTR